MSLRPRLCLHRAWLAVSCAAAVGLLPVVAEAGAADGTPCSGGGSCASGFCSDGVCCSEPCDGLCERCDGAGGASPGTCAFIPYGLDPQAECPEIGPCDTACDGGGGCSVLQCPDGEPCTDGSSCSSTFCADGFCCATACAGTCLACNLLGVEGSCIGIPPGTDPQEDCPDSGGCIATCAPFSSCSEICGNLGAQCADLLECDSMHCVDDVCCNANCNGICETCVAPGSVGLCQPVLLGEDPAGDCPPDGGCPGGCDGAGACLRCGALGEPCGADTGCSSGNCADGVCCESPCDGVCARCDRKGSAGFCTAVASGEDPDRDCISGVCDGAGGCRLTGDAAVILDASADASELIPLNPGGCDCGCVVAHRGPDEQGGRLLALVLVFALLLIRPRRSRRSRRRR